RLLSCRTSFPTRRSSDLVRATSAPGSWRLRWAGWGVRGGPINAGGFCCGARLVVMLRRGAILQPVPEASVKHFDHAIQPREVVRSEEHTSELQSPDHLVC